MRVLIDACVLYPTVLRQIVLGLAGQGVFAPLWSERILEEWRRAALRNGDVGGEVADAEIALARAAFPDATVAVSHETQRRLQLPDPDDAHVLAAAIEGQADELMTLNLKDFPTRTMAEHGILRRHPDGFLLEALHADSETVRSVIEGVLAEAAAHGIDTSNRRALLKRARLPRLAKALDQA